MTALICAAKLVPPLTDIPYAGMYERVMLPLTVLRPLHEIDAELAEVEWRIMQLLQDVTHER